MKILEMLVLKLPHLSLHIRNVNIAYQTKSEEVRMSFIDFIIKFVSWVGTDRLSNFLHNYICDINLFSYSYGYMLSKEVIDKLYIEINFNIHQPHTYYHTL